MSDKLVLVKRHLSKAKQALLELKAAKSADGLWDGWEDFLEEYGKSIGKLITLASSKGSSKGFAARLKNASTKDDLGLMYLREARNAETHGLDPTIKHKAGSTSLFGGLFSLGPNVGITLSGCSVNGVTVDHMSLQTDSDGRPENIKTNSPLFGSYSPRSIILLPVHSEQKRKTFDVPVGIGDKTVEFGSPLSLGTAAVEYLSSKINEFELL